MIDFSSSFGKTDWMIQFMEIYFQGSKVVVLEEVLLEVLWMLHLQLLQIQRTNKLDK